MRKAPLSFHTLSHQHTYGNHFGGWPEEFSKIRTVVGSKTKFLGALGGDSVAWMRCLIAGRYGEDAKADVESRL
jgi:hypothetical protein